MTIQIEGDILKRSKFKKMVLLILPLLLVFYAATVYFIKEIYYYNSKESFMQYIVYASIIIAAILIIVMTVLSLTSIKKNKLKSYIKVIVILIILILGEYFITFNLNKVSDSIAKVTNNYTNYSTSLIVMKDSNIKSVSDLKNKKIGIISDTNNTEGYSLAMELVKKEKININSLKSYDDYKEMLNDLYQNKINAVLISSSYKNIYATDDDFSNIGSKVKEISKKTKKVKKNNNSKKGKVLTEPFTILLVGVDSDSESLKNSNSFNGDTLMLITFNPNTLNTTILSIPRDTRVPIACTKNKGKNKINSSSNYGIDCVEDTITNFTGIQIDYWVKVNFQGVTSLVDALDGIEIDIPYAFCEQDSKRRFGQHTIYVEKGRQTLDGEKALAFARNRHPWPQYCGKKYSQYNSNDFVRGQNQQLIINAIANKLKSINSLSQIYDILDIVGDNIDTNIDKDTMITGFDTFKNIISKSKNIKSEDFIGTQRLYLSGYDNTINGIYYFEYYKGSLKDVTDAMKINLEIKKPVMDKDFSFSINSPYENKQIGKGTYKY